MSYALFVKVFAGCFVLFVMLAVLGDLIETSNVLEVTDNKNIRKFFIHVAIAIFILSSLTIFPFIAGTFVYLLKFYDNTDGAFTFVSKLNVDNVAKSFFYVGLVFIFAGFTVAKTHIYALYSEAIEKIENQ